MISFDKVIMDGIRDMVFVIRVENQSLFFYDFFNRAAFNGTSLTKNAIGKELREVYPDETAIFLLEQYQQVVDSNKSVTYEDSFLTPTGDRSYSETNLTPLFNEQGECQQIVAVVKDITKEKLAQGEVNRTLEYLNISKNRYKSLFHHNSDAIFTLDLKGYITNGNPAVQQVTGYKRKELIGYKLQDLVIEDDSQVMSGLFAKAMEGSTDYSPLTILNKLGNEVIISLKVTPLIINGQLSGIFSILRNITEFTTTQKELEESEERFRIIAENAHDLISLIDENGRIIYASPSYQQILGFNHQEYEGNLFLHNVHPDDVPEINEVILRSINQREPFTVQFRQYNEKGLWIWSESNGTPVFDMKNKFKHLVVLTRDISLQKKYEAKLEHFAHHDPLTGLPNRRMFNEKLRNALAEVTENNEGLAVIMMDIDHFKKINDTLGHDIGDWVIEEFGKRVSQATRECDVVARLGGDEFVILLSQIESSLTATTIAEEIQQSMHRPWEYDQQTMQVTTSMGIAIAQSQGITASTMLKGADNALYEAKDAGRNTYKILEVTADT